MISGASSLRYILRKLFKSVGFTATSIITLATGIGATTAIFSVVYSILLKPLPFPEAELLVDIAHTAPGVEFPELDHSVGTHLHYRELSRVLEETAVYDEGTSNVTGDGEPERLDVLRTSASLFSVLRATVATGRPLIEADNEPGASPVVVLSNATWRQRYASDPRILGRSIAVDGVDREIVGVMPADFSFPSPDIRLFIPMEIDPAEARFGNFGPRGVARLNPGQTASDAQSELQQLVQRLPERFPDATLELLEGAQFGSVVTPLLERTVGDVKRTLVVVLGAVGFVLLIACANVANLFMVRAEGHRKEIAIRTSLGAGSGALVRYFMAESLTLSTVSAILGIGLAAGSLKLLVALGPQDLPRLNEVGLSFPTLALAITLSTVVGVVFATVPIFKYGALNLATSLKDGSRSASVGRERHRARNMLVVSQVALAVVLLVGSGLMLQSFRYMKNVDPGFGIDGRLTVQVSLPPDRYDSTEDVADFHLEAAERLAAIPGVFGASAIANIPLGNRSSGDLVEAEGVVRGPNELPPVMELNWVSPNYFAESGIEFNRGEGFSPPISETEARQAVITEQVARRYWPDVSPLGKRLNIDPLEDPEDRTWYTVVGVVPDVRSSSLTEDPVETVYLQLNGSWTQRTASYVIRSSQPTDVLVPAVREAMRELDSNLPLANIRTMQEIASRSSAQLAFTMSLLGLAAVVALLLGSVGIYGVISYVFAQRNQEIGVRIALGAQRGTISRMVLKQGGMLTAVGLGVGLVAAAVLTRFMESLLFEVNPTDPVTFGVVTLLLALVSMLAAYVPARRAARTDPLEAFRE